MVVSAMKCGLFWGFASGKEYKNFWGFQLNLHEGCPALVSGQFLFDIKLLLFFSTKQCTYTYKPFSLPYLQAFWIYFSTPLTFLSLLILSLDVGLLCRVCNGELRDYTRDKWKGTMQFSSPGYNAEEPVVLGSGNCLFIKCLFSHCSQQKQGVLWNSTRTQPWSYYQREK